MTLLGFLVVIALLGLVVAGILALVTVSTRRNR